MVKDAKLNLIQNSISTALEYLSNDYSIDRRLRVTAINQNCPLFVVEVHFSQKELVFKPTKQELREAIKRAVIDGTQIVCQNEQFLKQPEFVDYTGGENDFDDKNFQEENDLMSLAIKQESMLRDTEAMYTRVEAVFNEVMDFSRQYQHYVNFHHQNRTVNYRDGSNFSTMEDFKAVIQTHQKQKEEIDEMEPETDIQIFRVQAVKMKEEIRRSPQACIDMLNEYLPKLAYDRLTEIYEEFA